MSSSASFLELMPWVPLRDLQGFHVIGHCFSSRAGLRRVWLLGLHRGKPNSKEFVGLTFFLQGPKSFHGIQWGIFSVVGQRAG